MKRNARDRVRARMLLVEQAFAGPWMLASGFSLVDIYAAMFTRWAECRGWADTNLPKIAAMTALLAQREAADRVWQRHFGDLK